MVLQGQIDVLSERISEREARIREREATVREREATVRAHESVIDMLRGAAPGELWPQPGEDVAGSIDAIVPRLKGWCTPRKAHWLAQMVQRYQARQICEIGVFGGRSLLPMALAARDIPGAVVWAVEPWSNAVAVEHATSEENDLWWREIDMQEIKRGFLDAVHGSQLNGTVKVVELPSDAAQLGFAQGTSIRFDLLHIDGSHAGPQALADVRNWLPLVAPGGIIVLDDIGWDSVAQAQNFLRRECETISEVREEDEVTTYGAYRVPALEKAKPAEAPVLQTA